MTTIYVIPDLVKETTEYICDSQATIDSAPKTLQTLCAIGTQTDADILFATNQQAWLTQQASLFTCNLQTMVEGGVVWTVVDLTTEQPNTSNTYFVLDPTTGLYTEAIGLDAAKALLVKMQQTYLVFTNMNAYLTETSWA